MWLVFLVPESSTPNINSIDLYEEIKISSKRFYKQFIFYFRGDTLKNSRNLFFIAVKYSEVVKLVSGLIVLSHDEILDINSEIKF